MQRLFTTHASLLSSLLTLTACGGGGGSANNDGVIEVVAPPPELVFTLIGTVDSSLGEGSDVFVDLGNQRFSATIDSQGRYELEIDSDASNALVSVNARGNGDQENIAFASALGDLETLKALAGNDARLTSDELSAVDITSVTTATVGLATIENNGVFPSTFAEWRSNNLNVNSEEMLIASAAIELAVADPAMQSMILADDASTMDLVTSVDRLYSVVSSIQSDDPETLPSAKQATVAKAATNLASRQDPLDRLFIYEPGYRSLALQFYADGSGVEFTNARLGQEPFFWTQTDNEVLLSYDDWVVDARIVMIDTDGDSIEEEVYEETVRKSTTLTFVAEGDGYDVVNIQTQHVKRYPEVSAIPPEVEVDHDGTKGAGRGSKVFFEANGDVFSSPSDVEEWILPIPGRFFEDYPDGLFFQSDITFDFVFFDPANVGAGAELGSFDWQTNSEGHLLITTETSRSLEFIPLGKLLLGVVERDDAGNVIGMSVGRGGKRVANANDITPGIYSLEWSWLSDANSRFWIDINEDGTAKSTWTFDNNGDGVVTTSEAITYAGDWDNQFEQMIINLYRRTDRDDKSLCPSADTEGCVLYNKRYWDMIDVDGGRFVMGHTHNFFDYLDDYQTRYLLDTRHWVKLNEAPIELVED